MRVSKTGLGHLAWLGLPYLALETLSSLVLGGCATQPPPKGRPRVAAVEVVGAEAMDESDAAEGLAHHEARGLLSRRYSYLDPLALTLDRRRIRAFYEENGYFDTEVSTPEVVPEDGEVRIRFLVEEGPPTLLEAIKIEGLPTDTSTAAWLEDAGLHVGAPVVYARYEAAKDALLGQTVRAGYPHARVEGEVLVDRERHRAVVRFVVQPGPKARFGAIHIAGLDSIPETSVENRLTFHEGDPFDPAALARSRSRLHASGLVGGVRFEWPREDQPQVLTTTVTVTELDPNELRLGLGLGLDPVHYELRAQAGYMRRRFIDPLTTLTTHVKPAWTFLKTWENVGPKVEASVGLVREDFLFPLVQASAEVSYRQTRYEGYQTLGPAFSLGASRSFVDDRCVVKLTGQVELPYVKTDFDRALGEPYGFDKFLPLLFVEPSISYDGRDDPVNPHVGYFVRLALEAGQGLGHLDTRYILVTPDLRGYLPIGSRLVAAGRLGFGTRLLSEGVVPVTRRYFGGGAENQRGFARRRLSPVIVAVAGDRTQRVPAGGEAAVESNVELRWDLFRLFGQWFGLAAFIDGGDTTTSLSSLDLSRLHWAAGGGLRYRTPIGPLRIDFGFRLNRRDDPYPDDSWAYHLTLGEAF